MIAIELDVCPLIVNDMEPPSATVEVAELNPLEEAVTWDLANWETTTL